MTEWAVEAHGLVKRYGELEVLRGVDLEVAKGTIFALLGPNGAGKTTTVRILATVAEADAGSARVAGADVVTGRHEVRRRIALTGQYAALDELQTGTENLRMMGRLARLPAAAARARAAELLERFDLQAAAGRRVSTYSGGMRRRLDLAASLVGRPEVIFLDEPTTGLDPRARQEMWAVVRELARGGTTVFLTTQYLEEADQLADAIAVVDGGSIVARGTATELKARLGGHRLDLIATDDPSYAALLDRLAELVTHQDPLTRTIGVPVTDSAAEIRALLDRGDPGGAAVARFELHSASLDDVFLALTGHPSTPEAARV